MPPDRDVRRALALTTGKELFDDARAAVAPAWEFIDLVPGVDVPDLAPDPRTLEVIDAIMARTPFGHVVATSESHMAFAGLLRSRYGLPGMNYEQSLVATNKWRMKQAVRGRWPTADAWLSGEFLHGAGARPDPVVIKPLSSSAARGVRRLSLRQARAELAAVDELLLVEEALDVRDELHCDGLVRAGRLEWAIASLYDRPVLTAGGTSVASLHLPSGHPRVEPAMRATRSILGAFDVPDYVFHLELMQVGEDLVFGEIGLRPPGAGNAESIARAYGCDLWQEFVAIQLGMPGPVSSPPRRREDICAVVGVVPEGDGAPDWPRLLERSIVTGSSPGKLKPGERPPDACTFSRVVFVEGLDEPDGAALLDELGLATR